MQGRREMLEERRKRNRAIRTSCGDDLGLPRAKKQEPHRYGKLESTEGNLNDHVSSYRDRTAQCLTWCEPAIVP
jgi:hypothetical protein